MSFMSSLSFPEAKRPKPSSDTVPEPQQHFPILAIWKVQTDASGDKAQHSAPTISISLVIGLGTDTQNTPARFAAVTSLNESSTATARPGGCTQPFYGLEIRLWVWLDIRHIFSGDNAIKVVQQAPLRKLAFNPGARGIGRCARSQPT